MAGIPAALPDRHRGAAVRGQAAHDPADAGRHLARTGDDVRHSTARQTPWSWSSWHRTGNSQSASRFSSFAPSVLASFQQDCPYLGLRKRLKGRPPHHRLLRRGHGLPVLAETVMPSPPHSLAQVVHHAAQTQPDHVRLARKCYKLFQPSARAGRMRTEWQQPPCSGQPMIGYALLNTATRA